MRPRIPACTLRTPISEIARRMRDDSTRYVLVASSGSDLIAGVITELDLLRAVTEGTTDGMASDIMTLDAPPTVRAAETLDPVVARMRQENIGVMVVVDGEPARPVGILSATEVAAFLARR